MKRGEKKCCNGQTLGEQLAEKSKNYVIILKYLFK